MNKVILGLILAVCVLGMALVMLNERLGRKPDTGAPQQTAMEEKSRLSPQPSPAPLSGINTPEPINEGREEKIPPKTPEEIEAAVRAFETSEAEAALAAPEVKENISEQKEDTPKPEPAPQKVETKPAPPKPEPKAEPEPARKPEPKPVAKAEVKPETPPKTAEENKPARSADKSITRFVVFSRDNGATIRISGNRALNYKNMVLDNPDRLVIDLDGDWKFPPNPGIPKNDFVSGIRVGKIGDKTRVVIDLKAKPRTSRVLPTKNGDSIDIRVDK